MKKMTFLFAATFAMIASSGCVLKNLHLPMGQEFMTVGFTGLMVVLIPLLSSYWRTAREGRWNLAFGFLSGLFLSLGVVLKVNYVVGANISLLMGGIFLSFGFIPGIFYYLYKHTTT